MAHAQYRVAHVHLIEREAFEDHAHSIHASEISETSARDLERELLPAAAAQRELRAAVAYRDADGVLAQREPGDVGGAEPVHVEHVPDPLERARLVGEVAVAGAQDDAQLGVARPRGDRGLDVAQVDRGDERDRACPRQRQPLKTSGFAPRPITTGSFTRRAKPTFSPSASVSTATTGTPHSRSSRHSRRPTCPSPTTTTWSRRGTARRPSRPVSRESTSRLISPPVKHAADSSVSSIEATIETLNHFGPSSMAGFGPTVASDLVEP